MFRPASIISASAAVLYVKPLCNQKQAPSFRLSENCHADFIRTFSLTAVSWKCQKK